MRVTLSSPANQNPSQSQAIDKQLAKFDDKKHFLKLDDKQGVVVVSKKGFNGFCNRVLKRLCPKQFNVQNVAVRIISKGPGSTTLQANPGFSKFRNKCQRKQTSSKSYHAAHELLTLGSTSKKIGLASTFETAMKIHFPNASLSGVDYKSENLVGPVETKDQAILNAIRGRFSDEVKLRGPLKIEKALQIILETVSYAAQIDSASLNVEELRGDVFHEYCLVQSNY